MTTPSLYAKVTYDPAKAGVANMVWYNYRRVPAVTMAKQLIDEGRLGKIFHYRAKFLQDWTISRDLPQGGEGLWRLDVAVDAGRYVTTDNAVVDGALVNASTPEATAAIAMTPSAIQAMNTRNPRTPPRSSPSVPVSRRGRSSLDARA